MTDSEFMLILLANAYYQSMLNQVHAAEKDKEKNTMRENVEKMKQTIEYSMECDDFMIKKEFGAMEIKIKEQNSKRLDDICPGTLFILDGDLCIKLEGQHHNMSCIGIVTYDCYNITSSTSFKRRGSEMVRPVKKIDVEV